MFVIDDDAFAMLQHYFDDIRLRCEESVADETLTDIEARVADIFTSELRSPNQVVGIDLVVKAKSIIGPAEAFGDYAEGKRPSTESAKPKLTRSRSERVIAGICGGLAQYFGIDVTLLRIITFLLIFFGGVSLWVYIVLWIIIPEEAR